MADWNNSGITWTQGKTVTVTNPDQTTAQMKIASGPLIAISNKYFQFYLGARPTAPWSPGYGDEGFLGGLSRWMKKIGIGNYGVALKIH